MSATLSYAALAEAVGRSLGEPAHSTLASMREPLELIFDDLARVALRPEGRRILAAEMGHAVAQRAALDAPGAAAGDLPRSPRGEVVVITGSPRTASTFLHQLMALDPRTATPTLAEGLSPTADPISATAYATSWLSVLDRLSPGLLDLHPMSPGGPDECITAMATSFVSERFLIAHALPSYGEWFDGHDHVDTYRGYASLLAQLYGDQPRLVLKAPAHLARLDAMAEAIPQTRYVILHRDPAAVDLSFARLVIAARRTYVDDVDERAARREWSTRLDRARRSVPSWAEATSHAVLHCDFAEVVSEPVSVLARIYAWLGWDFAEVRTGIEAGAIDLAATNRSTPTGRIRT